MPPPPARLLFVVPPLAGHVNPTVALGAALAGRGHAVAWAGAELFVRPLIGPDAALYATGSKSLRPQALGEVASARTLWADFVVPYARFTAKAVDAAVAAFRPDLVIADEHTPAGALVAERRGLPWATMASSAMELGDPWRGRPEGIQEWIMEQLRGLWERFGLDPDRFVDPRASRRLVLAATSPALAPGPFPAHYALVGPLLGRRPTGPEFPWGALDPGRRQVLVSMGTIAAEVSGDFHARALTAVEGLSDVQAIVVGAPESEPGQAPPVRAVPDNALLLPRVPMLELFGRGVVDAVLCHGGLNTVSEALAHGVPVVAAPIRHDQPITAGQVAAAGAGVRIDFAAAGPEEIAKAIRSVLDDPGYRQAARRVAAQFVRDGGVAAAVRRVEELLGELRIESGSGSGSGAGSGSGSGPAVDSPSAASAPTVTTRPVPASHPSPEGDLD